MRAIHWGWLLLLLLPLLGGVCGCDKGGLGQVALTIDWPAAPSASSSGLELMQSVQLEVHRGRTLVQTRIVSRPAEGLQSHYLFDAVPVGTYTLVVTASASTNGLHGVLGDAWSTVQVRKAETTCVRLTTVTDPAATLVVKPNNSTVQPGDVVPFIATLTNPDSTLALVPSGAFTWSTEQPNVASINPNNGETTAVGDGTTIIQVRDTRTGRTAQTSLHVREPDPESFVRITASPVQVRAGEPVTISWRSVNAYEVRSANFFAAGPTGSTIVFPRHTTTYSITVRGNGEESTDSVTVFVY